MEVGYYVATALTAYFVGSIPTGYLVARARGLDIRSVGSGNIGATNVFRILGKPAGISVLLVDALKGYVGCAFVPGLLSQFFGAFPAPRSSMQEYAQIVGGFGAIFGHNYTVWLKFKGGKGVATSAGVLAAILPLTCLTAIALWIVFVAGTRYVSIGSLVAAASLPFAAWLYRESHRMIAVAAVMGALAIYKHKANIQRLFNGTENRIGSKKSQTGGAR